MIRVVKQPKPLISTKKSTVKVKVIFKTKGDVITECSLDDGPSEPCSSQYTVEAQSAEGAGLAHTIRLQATDQFGNTGSTSIAFTVIRK